jgi:hypothetical protein
MERYRRGSKFPQKREKIPNARNEENFGHRWNCKKSAGEVKELFPSVLRRQA